MRKHRFTFSIIAFVLSLSALFIGVYSLNDTHLNINGSLGYIQQRELNSASVLNNKFKIDRPSLYQLYNDLNNDQSNAGVKVFLDGLKHEAVRRVVYINNKTPVKSEDDDSKYTFQMAVANYTEDLKELYLLCLDLNTYKYELLQLNEYLILIDKNEHIFQATCASMPFVGIFLTYIPE